MLNTLSLIEKETPLNRQDVEGILHELGSSSKLELSGKNLKLINLSFLQLSKANLNYAILDEADLHESILNGTQLSHASLIRANLTRASLIRAKLEEAHLMAASIKEANLSYARMNRIDLRDAILYKANLIGSDMQEADLSGANMQEADLRQAKLNNARLDETNLEGANLSGTYLEVSQKEFLRNKGVINLDKTIIGQKAPTLKPSPLQVSTMKVTLPDEQWLRLKEMAKYLGITLEELVQTGLEEVLKQPDETFKQIADYVLEKNAELYRRLA